MEIPHNDNCIHFVLTNARSLSPKINSFLDMMRELELNFAAVTETWFKGGAAPAQEISDIHQASGIKIIQKHRRANKRGGGVALAFRSSSCNFKERKIKGVGTFEVLCVSGTVGSIKRKIVVFVVYIPPNLPNNKMPELNELLATEIAAAKVAMGDPLFFVCGNLNGKDIKDAFDIDEDFSLIRSGPTMGENTLDKIDTNGGDLVGEVEVLPPLETETGICSDHGCVKVGVEVPQKRNFTWIRKVTRKRTQSADARFVEQMKLTDWKEKLDGLSVDEMVEAFEATDGKLTDDNYPLVSTRRRSNEDPWITNGIRRRAKRKRRLYRRSGRTRGWFEADEALQREVEKLLLEPERNYYQAVKRLGNPNKSDQWLVLELFPGARVEEAGDAVLEFFSSVGGDEPPSILPEIPRTTDAGLGPFDHSRVEALLRAHKKVKSRVDGDPLPHLVQGFPGAFARPVAYIFNAINRDVRWPTKWKREHITVIPKNPKPSSLSECRNISCTPYLSKVLEGVVLEKLRKELLTPISLGEKRAVVPSIWWSSSGTTSSGFSTAAKLLRASLVWTLRRRSTAWTTAIALGNYGNWGPPTPALHWLGPFWKTEKWSSRWKGPAAGQGRSSGGAPKEACWAANSTVQLLNHLRRIFQLAGVMLRGHLLRVGRGWRAVAMPP